MPTMGEKYFDQLVDDLGLQKTDRWEYGFDIFGDYRIQFQIGKDLDDSSFGTSMEMYCSRFGTLMKNFTTEHPDITLNLSGFSRPYDGKYADCMRKGLVTVDRDDEGCYILRRFDHLSNRIDEHYNLRRYLQSLMGIDNMRGVFDEFFFGLISNPQTENRDKMWSSIFMCLELGLDSAETVDKLMSPEFVAIRRRWGRKQVPLDTVHVKDLAQFYVPYGA